MTYEAQLVLQKHGCNRTSVAAVREEEGSRMGGQRAGLDAGPGNRNPAARLVASHGPQEEIVY